MGFAETFKALSDSVRRDILMLLREGRMSAGSDDFLSFEYFEESRAYF